MGRRLIAVIALVLGAGLLGLALAEQPEGYGDEVAGAVLLGELNDESAESAPQQQVVNGWVARDLMEIQTRQLDELARSSERIQWLLGGVAVLLGLVAASAWDRSRSGLDTGRVSDLDAVRP